MKKREEPWYRNPFYLGGVGLVALLAGYGLLASNPAAGALSPMSVAGRLTFLAGLLTTVAAGVVWFLDARAPEPLEEDDENEEEDAA
jgi:hypothetical protein